MKTSEKQLMIIFAVLGALLLALVIGILYYKSAYEKSFFTYHGFDFKRVRNGYEITLYLNEQQTPRTILLRSDPRRLEDIPLASEAALLTQKKEIFVTINPHDNLTGVTTIAVLELDKILDNPFLYNLPVNASFTEPYPFGGLGVKTCADATDDVAVLWFKVENETRVYEKDGCLIVAGATEDDLIRAADRIIYTILGIMDR